MRSSRTCSIASFMTAYVSSTSIPVAAQAQHAVAFAALCRSVCAVCRSSAGPTSNSLLVTMNTTGSFHSAAMFSVSPNVPWLAAPSPNTQTVTSSVPR